MTISEPQHPAGNDRAAVDEEGTGRWLSRRARMTAGAAAAAVLLGSGYLLLSDAGTQHAAPKAAGRAAADTAHVSSSPAPAGSATTRPPTPGSAAKELPPSAKERVAAARANAAKNRVEPLHPVSPKQDAAALLAADTARVVTVGSPKDPNGTMRIVTALGDLTGQRELSWIAGGVTAHGSVSCSHTVKLDNEQAASERANLLVCWRTSAKKSVVTVTAVVHGTPSVDRSVAEIEKQWRTLR